MNGWSLATHVAIWILIAGSALVFAWFLAEVLRLARRPGSAPERPPDGSDHDSSTRSISMEDR